MKTTSDNNSKHLPDRIAGLLELYYEGRTDAAQEAELTRYFTETADLPDGYEADAAIFRAMADYSTPDIPDDLEQRIIDATCGRAEARSRRWLPWLSGAAAAVVAAVMGISILTGNTDPQSILQPAQPDLTATVAEPADTTGDIPTETVEPAQPVLTPEVIRKAHDARPAQSVAENRENVDDYDPYIEITDTDSAATITREVLDRLNITLAMAGDAVNRADMAMNNADQTIKNIIQ
ncbi:MAG: hypothetical protein Q4C34_00165 [Bacteroidales bacterium]|nr:hypothetical protein [Bacteroidales bacterium]